MKLYIVIMREQHCWTNNILFILVSTMLFWWSNKVVHGIHCWKQGKCCIDRTSMFTILLICYYSNDDWTMLQQHYCYIVTMAGQHCWQLSNIVHDGQHNLIHAGQLNLVHDGQFNLVHAGHLNCFSSSLTGRNHFYVCTYNEDQIVLTTHKLSKRALSSAEAFWRFRA